MLCWVVRHAHGSSVQLLSTSFKQCSPLADLVLVRDVLAGVTAMAGSSGSTTTLPAMHTANSTSVYIVQTAASCAGVWARLGAGGRCLGWWNRTG